MTQGLLESQDVIFSYINRSCCQIMSEDHTKHVVRRQELKGKGLEMDDSSSDEDGEDNM